MSDDTRYGAGDLIWYHPTIHGGYGFKGKIPGVVKGYTPRRVRLALELRDGTRRSITVHPKNITRRDASEPIR